MRRILSVLILAVLIVWLALSYAPVGWLALPQIAFTGRWLSPLFQLLAMGGLLAVTAIQLVLIRATGHMLRPDGEHAAVVTEFRLKLGVELFWTALPLLMTLLLGAAAYQILFNQ